MDAIGFDELARDLEAAPGTEAAHRAFEAFSGRCGGSRWMLAEMRRGGEGRYVFDVLASSSAGAGAPLRTVGPFADDRVLARMWRARETLALSPSPVESSVSEISAALLGGADVSAVSVFPLECPDPSRRVVGASALGAAADFRTMQRGFALYAAFFARLRREAYLPMRIDLSPREIDVLQRCAHGMRASAIATALEVSAHTVREHTDRARVKLDARNLSHAVALAMRAGLIR